MRVLLTNNTLANRAGTELWVRDVALALRDRGHQPIAYSRQLGAVAAELRRATVPVVDDLRQVGEPPAIIHGHHHLETMTALLQFPGVPAIAFCHGWVPPEEAPPLFPRIHRYVAVDDLCRERLVSECGIPSQRVVVIRNFVDLRRFGRRPGLPSRPRRALAYSNHAREEGFVPALREACGAEDMTLDVVGFDSGNVAERPEQLLPQYDVVFAKGRSALEAAAVGVFVVLCDTAGLGPAVLPEGLARLRNLNFGVRLLTEAATPAAVRQRIALYSPAAAAEVSVALRDEAGLDKVVDQLLELYREVCAEAAATPPTDVQSELQAAARYLRQGPLHGGDIWRDEREMLLRETARAAGQRDAMAAELDALRLQLASQHEQARPQADLVRHQLEHELSRQQAELSRQQAELSRQQVAQARTVEGLRTAEAELAARRAEVAWITGTAAWRWRQRLIGRPRLAALYRRLRRPRAGASRAMSEPTARTEAAAPAASGSIGERAARMVAAGGFLGVPLEEFEEEGRQQLATLLRLGLRPQSRVLDIGCGCLRGGYWLIHFLDAGRYCGIEPHRQRLELGLSLLLEPGVAAAKRPRFDSSADFDTGVFGERFDVFLARSIWTHASKPQIQRMLDGFRRDGAPGALFLTSYLPAGEGTEDDYRGTTWVGTSHECDVPGVIRHDLTWVRSECAARGLVVEERPEDDYGGQRWLVLRAGG